MKLTRPRGLPIVPPALQAAAHLRMPVRVRRAVGRMWRNPAIGHRRSGGQLMQKPLKALLATSAILFAACTGGTSSNAPSGPAGSAEASVPAPTTSGTDIFNSAYAPTAGTKGGQILIGDWQEANQFNPFYS